MLLAAHPGLSLGEAPTTGAFPPEGRAPRRRALSHELRTSLPNSPIVSVSFCRIFILVGNLRKNVHGPVFLLTCFLLQVSDSILPAPLPALRWY